MLRRTLRSVRTPPRGEFVRVPLDLRDPHGLAALPSSRRWCRAWLRGWPCIYGHHHPDGHHRAVTTALLARAGLFRDRSARVAEQASRPEQPKKSPAEAGL